MFYLHCEKKELKGLVAGHVDDFFWGGERSQEGVIDRLRSTFHISSDLHDSFNFLGLDFRQLRSGIEIDQSIYAQGLQLIPLPERGDKHRLLSDDEKIPLRSAIGHCVGSVH